MTKSKQKNLVDFKVTILGMQSVGKSSLVNLCIGGRFNKVYTPTIHEDHTTELNIEDEKYKIKISDYMGTSSNYIPEYQIDDNDGFILVYAIDNEQSFQFIEQITDRITDHINYQTHNRPIILVGNKTDLENARKVDQKRAESLKDLHKLTCFKETSAKNIEQGIPDAFEDLVKVMATANKTTIRRKKRRLSGKDKRYNNSSNNLHQLAKGKRSDDECFGTFRRDYRKTYVKNVGINFNTKRETRNQCSIPTSISDDSSNDQHNEVYQNNSNINQVKTKEIVNNPIRKNKDELSCIIM